MTVFERCVCIAVLLISLQTTTCQVPDEEEYVAAKSFYVIVNNNVRQITVKYDASSKPRVYWNIWGNELTGNNFEITKKFTDTEGETSLSMPTDHFSEDPEIDISLSFKLDEFSVTLQLYNGAILTNSFASDTVMPIFFTVRPGSTVNYNKGDVVYLNVSVVSEDEERYHVGRTSLTLDTLDYFYNPPERVRRFAIDNLKERVMSQDKALVMPNMMSLLTNNTILASSTARLDTSYDLTEGRLTFSVEVGVSSSIVRHITMTREIYVKEQDHDAPFRANSLTFDKRYDLFGSPYDDYMYVSETKPTIDIMLMGNPRPTVKLYRGCTELLQQPVVAKFESRTRYTNDVTFKFNNVSEALEGVYVAVATSGTTELRYIFFVEARL